MHDMYTFYSTFCQISWCDRAEVCTRSHTSQNFPRWASLAFERQCGPTVGIPRRVRVTIMRVLLLLLASVLLAAAAPVRDPTQGFLSSNSLPAGAADDASATKASLAAVAKVDVFREEVASGLGAEPPSAKQPFLHSREDNNTELWWWRKKSPPSAPPPSVPPPAAPPSELITLTNALLNGAIPHVEKYLDELIFKAVNQPNELVFDSLKATKSGGSAKLTAADIIKKMETTLVDLAMRDTAVDTSLPPTFASSTVGLNIDVATLITMAGSQQQTTGLPTVKVRHPKTRAYKTHARTCMRRHSRPNSSVMYVNVRAYAHYRQRRRGAHRLGDLLLLRVSRSRRVRTHHNSVVPYGP